MRLKHWQGYGSVDVHVISKTEDQLVIEVKGMHEYGLETNDYYHIETWLIDHVKGYKGRKIKTLNTVDCYEKDLKSNTTIEKCVYTITLKSKNTSPWD